jgi:hypothetical protein
MQELQYLSTHVPEKISLAEASWPVFSPFLGRLQWAFDDPGNSPRAVEIASAILNRGTKGRCTFWRREGYKYILPVLHPRHFEDAISNRRKIYYVSFGSYALLYFDIDLHYAWQTLADGQEAKRLIDALLRKFFGASVLFWSPSSRGFNGYLKVDLKGMDYALANQLFDRLEAALQRFLAFCGNLADFEIKGKIGFMEGGQYQWAQYGKLPIHLPEWSFAKLEELKATPTVSIHRLDALCNMVEGQVPQDVLQRHKESKKARGDEPFKKGDRFLVTPAIEKLLLQEYGDTWRCKFSLLWGSGDDTWLHEDYYRPGLAPRTDAELREQPASAKDEPAPLPVTRPQPKPEPERSAPPPPTRSPSRINLDLSELTNEPDSFERQREAMLCFARYLKRVPSLEEGMQLLHDHGLFTGSWHDRLTRRKTRVHNILAFVAETFDPSKCANGHVNVGRYDEWARKKFPNGLVGGHRRGMDEDGNIVEVAQNIHVSTKFIAVFMAVAEFALLIDKNQDGSVPHDRCEALWRSLKAKGLIDVCWNDRKWPVCREELAKHGIIVITDRNYGPDQAMKWAPARYFPGLGLWKTKKQPCLLGPVDLASFLQGKNERTEQTHNTFLSMKTTWTAVFDRWRASRPPP